MWRETTKERWRCDDCQALGLQEARGCGFTTTKTPASILVWKNKDLSYRHDLDECPVSVLHRNRAYVSIVEDWILLGSLPYDSRSMGISCWLKISAMKAEAVWLSHQVQTDEQKHR